MAYITGSVIDGLGTLPFSLSAGTQLTMSIQNTLVGASYYGLETFLNQDGFYTSATPKNLLGSFVLGPGITDIVYDNYKMVAVVQPGGGSLVYTPAINIGASTLATKGTGANLGKGDFATLLTNGFSTRVTRDGGIVEDPGAITNTVASQSVLQYASYLMIPSGYKEDTLFSQLSTNDYGDLTWTRASDAWRTNSSGLVQRMPWNLLQYSQDFSSSAWGKTGQGSGVAPITTLNQGIAPNQTNTANRVQFNCVGTTNNDRSYLRQQYTSAAVGNIYIMSFYIKAFSQSEVGKQLRCIVENGGVPSTIITIPNDWQLITLVGTGGASSSAVNFLLETRGGNTINTTADVLLWGAQLVEGTQPLDYFPTTDRLNVPRLDYTYGTDPAALLEPQRTNSLRNSTMVGAVPGNPGTSPTFWVTDGVDRVVRTGSENGLNYIDLLLSGSGTTTADINIRFESSTQIVASNGQTWTSTFYARVISGSIGSSGKMVSSIDELTNVGVRVNVVTSSIAVSTSSLDRFTFTKTLNGGASTARIRSSIDYYTDSTPYNFVLRLAAPQLESGSYATTFIPTTTAAATRVVDSFSRNNIFTNGLITSSGGTWFVELRNNVAYIRDSAGFFGIVTSSTSSADGFVIKTLGGGTAQRLFIGKRVADFESLLYTTTTDTVKIAIKWNGSTAGVFVNGTKQVSATSFTVTNLEFLSGAGTDVPKFTQQMALFNEPISNVDAGVLTGASYFTSFAKMAQADNYTIA